MTEHQRLKIELAALRASLATLAIVLDAMQPGAKEVYRKALDGMFKAIRPSLSAEEIDIFHREIVRLSGSLRGDRAALDE